MTPTQLRAFACVVRLGSVKAAAKELAVSEAAVSMHVAQLRKEFDDLLFTRASSGLAFTPGGLRLASRAVEILGLQDRTVREVSQAGHGRRVLRLACTSLFAEHAAPGPDRPVRGARRRPRRGAQRATGRAVAEPVAGAFGRRGGRDPSGRPATTVAAISFLRYEVVVAARPGHPLAGHPVGGAEVAAQMWALGPAAVGTDRRDADRAAATRRSPRSTSASSRATAAAIEETKGSDAVTLAVRFAIGADVAARPTVAS